MALQDDLAFAIDLARRSGQIAREQYGKVKRLTKRNDEAVTDADRACQALIHQAIKAGYPRDGFIGEENETGLAITCECPDPRGRVWVVDPIDGTNNFVAGFGHFATCIGLLDAGHPVLGVVYDVIGDVMHSAAKGLGAWVNNRTVRVAESPIGDSSIVMSSSNLIDANGRAPDWPSRWLGRTPWKIRVIGSAALDGAHVAAGIAHGAITIHGKLWDAVAPAALVIEAGGLVTDTRGKAVFPYNLERYAGARVPTLMATPIAQETLLREIKERS
jgi:myo-inositol-1(or 4)-monophosphatase